MPISLRFPVARAAALLVGVAVGQPMRAAAQPPAGPTPLRLADALAEAEEAAFPNRQARANAEAEHARARVPLKGILPAARVEAGFVRTTDPIGAFGMLLRQRQVTPAAFDPARLNFPAPVNNMTGGLLLDVPVLNADALTGWKAARAAARASDAAADWVHYDVRLNVVRAYFGATLAQEKVAMLTTAYVAAQTAVRQVEHMVQQGLVTKADALQASVRAADVAAQLSAARSDATGAKQQLALLLGRRNPSQPDAQLMLPTGLPVDSVLRGMTSDTTSIPVRSDDVQSRADIEAARYAREAARLDARRAAVTLLPRVNGFARYDWNAPAALYAGRPNWTVGVMASWSVFGGGSELAEMAGANARARLADVANDAARTQAALEANHAERAVQVALERMDLMAQATNQSREAHRLVEKRYAGGLATMAERLAAETSATSAALQHAGTRFELIVAIAAHRLAVGGDPGDLATLDEAPRSSTTTSTTPSTASPADRE